MSRDFINRSALLWPHGIFSLCYINHDDSYCSGATGLFNPKQLVVFKHDFQSATAILLIMYCILNIVYVLQSSHVSIEKSVS